MTFGIRRVLFIWPSQSFSFGVSPKGHCWSTCQWWPETQTQLRNYTFNSVVQDPAKTMNLSMFFLSIRFSRYTDFNNLITSLSTASFAIILGMSPFCCESNCYCRLKNIPQHHRHNLSFSWGTQSWKWCKILHIISGNVGNYNCNQNWLPLH